VAKQNSLARAKAALREYALSYPEAKEEFPWGECAIKIKGKIFVNLFHGEWRGETFLNVTVKLPVSGPTALTLPFASPTAYGLGKSGWVSARFNPGDDVPVPMLQEWIDESFRAIAPKRVLAKLEETESKKGRSK
jgi:predicted DNA-binding protein (MmcQ/YjbR family)